MEKNNDLPNDWIITTLEKVGKITTGNTPSKKDPANYGTYLPWVKPPQLDQHVPIIDTPEKLSKQGSKFARILEKNSILISCIGDLGKIGIAGTKLATNQQINSVLFSEKVIPKYGYYFFKSPFFSQWLNENASATVIPIINKGRFSKATFILCSLNEQKRIVEKIEELLSKIDCNKELLENNKLQLKQYKKSLLEFAFKGKLTQSWRQENEYDVESELFIFREFKNKIPKIDSKLMSEIHENDLKLYIIPKTWKWVRLGFLSKLITKGASPKWQGVEYVDDGILFVTSENVGTGQILLKKPKFLEKKFNEIQKRSILQKGDILTNIVGASIGRTAIYDLDDDANINQAVSLIRTFDKVNRKYIQHALNSPHVLDYMNLEKVDVARANLSLQNVADFPIPLPPLKEQEQIILKIEQIFLLIKHMENMVNSILSQLDILQASILKQAFEGKLVPQDPNDEPASELLKRIKNLNN